MPIKGTTGQKYSLTTHPLELNESLWLCKRANDHFLLPISFCILHPAKTFSLPIIQLDGTNTELIFPTFCFCFFCFRSEERLCLKASIFFSVISVGLIKHTTFFPRKACFNNTFGSFSYTTSTIKVEQHCEALHPSPTTIPQTAICPLLRGNTTEQHKGQNRVRAYKKIPSVLYCPYLTSQHPIYDKK